MTQRWLVAGDVGVGTGDGSSRDNARAYAGGTGLSALINAAVPGDRITLRSDGVEYEHRGTITIPSSASGAGDADSQRLVIEGEYTGSSPLVYTATYGVEVPEFAPNWPTINLQLNDGFVFAQNTSYVSFRNFTFINSPYRTSVASGQNHVALLPNGGNVGVEFRSIYLSDCIEFVRVTNSTATNRVRDMWIEHVWAVGHQKRIIHWDGVVDSTIRNVSATTYRSTIPPTRIKDWALQTRLGGDSADCLIEYCEMNNPDNTGAPSYDPRFSNGDGFTTEEDTARITFRFCKSWGAIDASADTKGADHIFDGCTFGNSGRVFRNWDDAQTIRNSKVTAAAIAGEANKSIGHNDRAAFWCRDGALTVDACEVHNPGYIANIDNTGTISFINRNDLRLGVKLPETRGFHTIDPLGGQVIFDGNEVRSFMARLSSATLQTDTQPPVLFITQQPSSTITTPSAITVSFRVEDFVGTDVSSLNSSSVIYLKDRSGTISEERYFDVVSTSIYADDPENVLVSYTLDATDWSNLDNAQYVIMEKAGVTDTNGNATTVDRPHGTVTFALTNEPNGGTGDIQVNATSNDFPQSGGGTPSQMIVQNTSNTFPES